MNQFQQLGLFDSPVTDKPPYAVLDFETGGLYEKVNGLCSVAIVRLNSDFSEADRFYAVLYEPDKRYDPDALRVNGFTLEQLQRDGMRPDAFIPILHGLLDGCIIICHNAQFDVRWLNARGWNIQTAICTMEASWGVWPTQKAKLGIVYNRLFGHDFVGAHNALDDVLATIEVLKWFQQNRPEKVAPAKINWDRFKR